MAKRPNDDELAAWRAFLAAHAAVTGVLERELEDEVGLPLSWFDVLVQLREAPDERLRMSALAESVLLSRSGLTRLVDRLEREGLVRRERCKTDARGWFVVLTETGRRTLTQAAPVHLRGVAEHFTDLLSSEDLRVVHRAMSTIGRTATGDPQDRR